MVTRSISIATVFWKGCANIAVGAHVSYAEELGEKGPQASTVKVLSKHSMRT